MAGYTGKGKKKTPGIPPSATTKSKVLISMMIYEP